MRLRALIVDDEPYARERVRRLLAEDGEVEVVGECADGVEAVRAIRTVRPDLLFLDVQMPGCDGFGVLDALGADAPVVIFLTAYDRYAVRAFDACAIDYLLKPFDEERFAKALGRAKAALAAREPERESRAAEPFDPSGSRLERFVVRSGGRILFLKVGQVDWIEASGNYVRLHAAGVSYLVRESLANLEARLDPALFVRIHRSTLVNFERVRALEPLFHGSYEVVLEDGTRLTLSRRFRPNLRRFTSGEGL
jgi:two-component system, LytTR family, response regulator